MALSRRRSPPRARGPRRRSGVVLDLVKEKGEIMADEATRIRWEEGQASALDRSAIAQGLDVGNVVVEERGEEGDWVDAVYTVDFAFAFRAFYPDVPIVTGECVLVSKTLHNSPIGY